MDKGIFKYLEFLLPIHNCVTIPDFGGFIVNIKPSLFDYDNRSYYTIVFNPDLNHNDGIIASQISKDENISYNAACNKIKDFVKAIQFGLKSGKTIICNIGILTVDNSGNPTFLSNRNIIHPTLYGLQPIDIKPLSLINNIIRKERRYVSIKYVLGSVAAALAAMLLFTGPNTDIADKNGFSSSNASFVSSITTSLPNFQRNINQNSSSTIVVTDNDKETNNPPTRTYYIIIGGEENKVQAEKLLDKIRTKDFANAAIVETSDRYRIFISSFDDKKQAEEYLDLFRKENPKYQTAWLYSKRNL